MLGHVWPFISRHGSYWRLEQSFFDRDQSPPQDRLWDALCPSGDESELVDAAEILHASASPQCSLAAWRLCLVLLGAQADCAVRSLSSSSSLHRSLCARSACIASSIRSHVKLLRSQFPPTSPSSPSSSSSSLSSSSSSCRSSSSALLGEWEKLVRDAACLNVWVQKRLGVASDEASVLSSYIEPERATRSPSSDIGYSDVVLAIYQGMYYSLPLFLSLSNAFSLCRSEITSSSHSHPLHHPHSQPMWFSPPRTVRPHDRP